MPGPIKVLLAYDIKAEQQERYYRYVTGQFASQTHQLGLELTEVWETAWGKYPLRLIALVAADREVAASALASPQWGQIEKKLSQYVTSYSVRVVPYRSHFQF